MRKLFFIFVALLVTITLFANGYVSPISVTDGTATEEIGVFSIGEGKTVTFSRGNLQYTQSTNTWSFAENQYDYIGTDNVTGGSVSSDPTYGDGTALADKIDLFGWSTSATNFGVSTSTSRSDYLGTFVDWGTNQIGTDAPNTWRTLTYDEWKYLRFTRTNANALCGVAQVNGVNGLVFLPDNWTCPEGMTFKSGFHSDYGEDYYAAYQTFTADQWLKLESAGAVFLPAAGGRYGSGWYDLQLSGYYWSATERNSNDADKLHFYSFAGNVSSSPRYDGHAVRLIKDVNHTTPEPPVEPETEEIFIYQPVDSVTICASELPYIWRGMVFTEGGTYTHEEIVEEENYIYHYIFTLELTVLREDPIEYDAEKVTICASELPYFWVVDGEYGQYWVECETAGTYEYTELECGRAIYTLELAVLEEGIVDTIWVEAYDSYEWHGEVYTESGVYTYEEWCYQEILELTIIETPTPPEPEIPTEGIGVFSISEGKTVTFSPGNLQYHPANDEWRFAENQTDYIGSANSNISATYSGWLDLFGWGTGDVPTKSSESYSDYKTFVDWGTNKISNDAPNTWRTLSNDEWGYIFYNRPNAQSLFALGSVNGVNGTIILPDNWTTPVGVSFVASTTKGLYWNRWYYYNSNDNNFSHNTYTSEQWVKMEQEGAVFLPASGNRWGTSVTGVDNAGYYWSTTEAGMDYAHYVVFTSDELYPQNHFYFHKGHSVRLVKDLSNTTPEPPVEPQDTTIYLPTVYETICEGETVYWWGMYCTEGGIYTYEEIVEDENYIYHYIHTLELQVIAPPEPDTIVVEAYDSYEWHGKVYTESGTYIYEEHCYQEILQLTIIDTPTPPEPEIPTEGIGVFSVGEGKTVTFSRGNLQYTQSTDTWSFAENQWEMIGTDNVTGGSVSSSLTYGDSKSGNALADMIDLFGWSTSATNFGVSTSKSTIDYSGSFVDWGTNQIGTDAPNTWRTLTGDEWYYLRYTRTNADALCGVAQVNGVNGLVFLPDNWTCPEGATFKSGFHSDDSKEAYGQYQTFTSEQWSKLEAAGAVFLSASGTRSGSTVNSVQRSGHYWSANEYNGDYARCLYFYSDEAGWGGFYRDAGRSVRLVKDVNSTTPEPPVEPEIEEIFIYQPVDSVTICASELPYIWRGMRYTEAGTYTYAEIVEDENYIYHNIYTLDLTVIPSERVVLVEEAYDSYEWHGVVYTESGVYFYEEYCYQEILELTIIPSTETAVDNMQTDSDHSAQKILRDQQILILRDGKTYTIMGAEVK